MNGMDLIGKMNTQFRTFETIHGRKPDDAERKEICRKVHLEYKMLRTIQRYNLPETISLDELRDRIELDDKLHDKEVLEEREKEYRLMHGIPENVAEASYTAFMTTVPERYKSASLSDFNEGATIVQHILGGGSCLLTGPVGCGKTRLLYAVCKHLCRNYEPYEVVMDTLPNLIAKIHQDCGSNDWLEYADERYCKQTKILVIDEFDKCKGSDSDYEIFNHIVNSRYGNMLQTIVAGNGDIEKAKNILGDAVVSRLTGRADGGRYFFQKGSDRRQ